MRSDGETSGETRGQQVRKGQYSWQFYLITKLIYFWVLGGLLYESAVYRASEKMHGPLGAVRTMTHSVHMQMHTTGVGHVMRCNTGRIRNETFGVGLGLGGHRDGLGLSVERVITAGLFKCAR